MSPGSTTMKLATALSERADLQKCIADLGNRLKFNAKIQEGETPSEDPQVLLAELQKQVDRLSKELRETDETIQGLNWTTELI